MVKKKKDAKTTKPFIQSSRRLVSQVTRRSRNVNPPPKLMDFVNKHMRKRKNSFQIQMRFIKKKIDVYTATDF